jgi:lipid II:glycine glycyltransferase (peptidoglycan interpeptide bridge formation enzyme)
MFRILLARADSRYIGAVLLLLHKGRLIDWYAGSDREFSAHAPSELLIWHALEWGSRNDFQIFDFGGAGKPSEEYGPRRFKEKFGGRRVNFGRNICIHSPLKLKISQAGYKVLRRIL